MANIKSQIKRNKQNEKRHQRNKAVKSELKTLVRKFREAAEAGDKDAALEASRVASRKLDKAVSKGVIHKNQAANRKSADHEAGRLSLSLPAATRRRLPGSAPSALFRTAVAQPGHGEHHPLQGVRRVAGRALDVGIGLGDGPDRPGDAAVGPAAGLVADRAQLPRRHPDLAGQVDVAHPAGRRR